MEASDDQGFKKQRQDKVKSIRRQSRQGFYNKRRQTGFDCGEPSDRFNVIDQERSQMIEELIRQSFQDQMLNDLINCLFSTDILLMHKAVIGIRKIAAQNSSSLNLLFQAANGQFNVIQRITKLALNQQFPQIRLEATWILRRLTTGQSDHIRILADANAIPTLIQLLQKNQQNIIDQAILAIGNLTGESALLRDQVIQEGGVSTVIDLFHSPNTKKSNQILCVLALVTMCMGRPSPSYESVKSAVPVLCSVIKTDLLNQNSLALCLWAIASMTEGRKEKLTPLIQSNATINRLISFIKIEGHPQIIQPTLKVLGNISIGSGSYAKLLVSANILSSFQLAIQHNSLIVRRQINWVLSNICAGNESNVEQFIVHHPLLLQKALKMFQCDSDEVKKQMCYVFSNIFIRGDPCTVANVFMKEKITDLFCQCLKSSLSSQLVMTALDSLSMVLYFGERHKQLLSQKFGYRKEMNIFCQQIKSFDERYRILSELQMSSNEQISRKVHFILEQFHQITEDNENLMID